MEHAPRNAEAPILVVEPVNFIQRAWPWGDPNGSTCTSELYCYMEGRRRHIHEWPGQKLYVVLNEKHGQFMGYACYLERAACRRPVKDYADPVLPQFMLWTAGRLRHLASQFLELLTALEDGDEEVARALVTAVRKEAVFNLGMTTILERRQARQRSGHKKAMVLDEVYGRTKSLFFEALQDDLMMDLVEWVLSGDKPDNFQLRHGVTVSQRRVKFA